MTISKKLSFFFAGVIAVFCVLAIALLGQLRTLTLGYDALLNSPVRQMQEARVAQVDFKKQVQEWKDILLRGHDADDLANYTKKFRDKQAQVRLEAETLRGEVTDAQTRQLLEQFLNAHDALGKKYDEAYAAYLAGNADFKAADKIVRGQDRAPTDLFDRVVERLGTVTNEALAAQRVASARSRKVALGTAGGLLLLVGLGGLWIVHDVLARMRRLKEVSDRLARADVSGLVIDLEGHDEIAEFGHSLKGVHAAIEELLNAATANSVPQSAAQSAGRG